VQKPRNTAFRSLAIFVAALLALALIGQRELHLKAMPIAAPLVAQQLHARRQIQLDFDFDPSHPWPPLLPAGVRCRLALVDAHKTASVEQDNAS
jgi:hypothetical protein